MLHADRNKRSFSISRTFPFSHPADDRGRFSNSMSGPRLCEIIGPCSQVESRQFPRLPPLFSSSAPFSLTSPTGPLQHAHRGSDKPYFSTAPEVMPRLNRGHTTDHSFKVWIRGSARWPFAFIDVLDGGGRETAPARVLEIVHSEFFTAVTEWEGFSADSLYRVKAAFGKSKKSGRTSGFATPTPKGGSIPFPSPPDIPLFPFYLVPAISTVPESLGNPIMPGSRFLASPDLAETEKWTRPGITPALGRTLVFMFLLGRLAYVSKMDGLSRILWRPAVTPSVHPSHLSPFSLGEFTATSLDN